MLKQLYWCQSPEQHAQQMKALTDKFPQLNKLTETERIEAINGIFEHGYGLSESDQEFMRDLDLLPKGRCHE